MIGLFPPWLKDGDRPPVRFGTGRRSLYGKVEMQNPKSDDRRTRRTRSSLTQALLALLPERGWDELTVQDLCERANIGRSTFYAHFQSKDELLVGSLKDLRSFLAGQRQLAREAPPAHELGFMRALLEHIDENKMLCRAIFGRRSGHVVQTRFREMITELVRDSLAPAPSGWQREATVHFIAGALVELLAWFVDSAGAIPITEVERHFTRLCTPAIRELFAQGAPS